MATPGTPIWGRQPDVLQHMVSSGIHLCPRGSRPESEPRPPSATCSRPAGSPLSTTWPASSIMKGYAKTWSSTAPWQPSGAWPPAMTGNPSSKGSHRPPTLRTLSQGPHPARQDRGHYELVPRHELSMHAPGRLKSGSTLRPPGFLSDADGEWGLGAMGTDRPLTTPVSGFVGFRPAVNLGRLRRTATNQNGAFRPSKPFHISRRVDRRLKRMSSRDSTAWSLA